MNEIACRATSMLVEAVIASGIDPECLIEGLPIRLSELTDRRRRIDWDTFAALHDNLERALGRGVALEDVGARIVRAPSYGLLQAVGSIALDSRTLHRVGCSWLAPALFPHLRFTMREATDGTLVVVGEVPSGYREASAFFHVCAGSLRMVSTLIGERASIVEAQIGGRRAVFTITPPPRASLLTRVRRRAQSLLGMPTILHALGEEQHAVNASYHALLRTREGFLDALEQSPACALIQRDGAVAWVNTALARALGHAGPEGLYGRPLLELSAPEDRPSVVERLRQPARETPASREYRLLRLDGTIATFEIAPTAEIEFKGHPARLLVGIDVSERQKMQEQLVLADRMASLGMLAAGVAHEINNPLTYVLMNLEIASASVAGDPARSAEALATAREGVERIRGVASDLKAFARVGGDAITAVDVRALLDSTLSLVAHALRQRATVVRDYAEVPPVAANVERLGQVFLNLLLNALDALPEGSAGHRIEVRTRVDERARVLVEIADTGSGIAPEQLGRVFDPFFTTKPMGSGTGLGLAICHGIVRGLGGEITIESQPADAGQPLETLRPPTRTTVRVALPPTTDAVSAKTRSSNPPASPRRGRILAIDDEEALLRALAELLRDTYDVQVVSSGSAALELLRRDRRFDAVLCDLMMPGVSGMDVFEELERIDGGFARRVVFMTGGAFTTRARQFLVRHPNRRLEKPFDRETVLELLEASGTRAE